MATSAAVSALRAELEVHKKPLAPILRGLRDMVNDSSLSAEARGVIQGQIDTITSRLAVVETVLAALSGLEGNGYPDLPHVVIPPDVMDELIRERDDIAVAVGIFEAAILRATALTITLGDPVRKTVAVAAKTKKP